MKPPRHHRQQPDRISFWTGCFRPDAVTHDVDIPADREEVSLPPYLPNVNATLQCVRAFLELDACIFGKDGVDQLFLTSGDYVSQVIAHFQNYRIMDQGKTPRIWLQADKRLSGVAEYASSYRQFAALHQRLRGVDVADRDWGCQLIVGVKAGVPVPAEAKFPVPLDSVRLYAGEHSFRTARISTRALLHPNLYAQPLPSAMTEGVADIFRDADALAREGLL